MVQSMHFRKPFSVIALFYVIRNWSNPGFYDSQESIYLKSDITVTYDY